MSGGRIQLASVGAQDEYITGSPQITYFLKKFKRHTRFAIETMDNGLDGDAIFGGRLRCTVPRKGDLIRSIFLRVELSELLPASSNIGYTDSIGHALIEYADLIIGGKLIERLTGEYLEIYSDFCVGNSQQKAIELLVGKTKSRTGLGPASSVTADTSAYYGKYPRVFMIPLPFYFHRQDSLSIPLSALTHHEIEVVVKLRNLENVVVQPSTGDVPVVPTGSIVAISMPIEYVFLTDEENKYIKERTTDYIITQLQLSRFTIDAGVSEVTMRTQFTNPVKELYVVIQNQDVVASNIITGNDWFNFKNPLQTSFPRGEQLASLELTFNNETRLSENVANALYLRYVHPMQFHTRIADRNVYNYSFSLDPENHIPSGQVNMSRIQNKLLKITTTPNSITRDVRVYALSYNILRINAGLGGVIFANSLV
jgi:hypothetical protein